MKKSKFVTDLTRQCSRVGEKLVAVMSQLLLLPICSLYVVTIVAGRVNVLITTYVASSIKGIAYWSLTFVCLTTFSVGELRTAIKEGSMTEADVHAEIGEVYLMMMMMILALLSEYK